MVADVSTEHTALPRMRLELVPVPVSDIDRARDFYANKAGFHVDHDVSSGNGIRVVQLTPPGSACSILLGIGLNEISEMLPGSVKGLHLVVDDIAATRELLTGRGVEVGEIIEMKGVLFARFADPDGNSWLLQQIPPRFGMGE